MKFRQLRLEGWRQFEEIKIDFDDRLTIITGANGAGKSTILRLLAQHFGLQNSLLSTPTYGETGLLSYISGIFGLARNRFASPLGLRIPSRNTALTDIGTLMYSNLQVAQIGIPLNGGASYNVTISAQQNVQGLHIGSHRPVQAYQQVTSIPTNAISAERAYQLFDQETKQRYQNGNSQFSPIFRMKEALISMATFGPGNQYVQRNDGVARLFDEFKQILSQLLPTSIGFRDISVRIPDVVMVTDTGDFMLDAASGGLMSLIELAWQIFLYAHDKEEFVVTMDEPENHLHPSMQRSLLRRLVSAFPGAQFVVATHSPFIVSSVRESSVYVLKYSDPHDYEQPGVNSKVISIELDQANKAATASEILRGVLGVPVTLPEWAEDDLRLIAGDFEIDSLNSQGIADLRHRLDEAGLGEYYPEALRQITGSR